MTVCGQKQARLQCPDHSLLSRRSVARVKRCSGNKVLSRMLAALFIFCLSLTTASQSGAQPEQPEATPPAQADTPAPAPEAPVQRFPEVEPPAAGAAHEPLPSAARPPEASANSAMPRVDRGPSVRSPTPEASPAMPRADYCTAETHGRLFPCVGADGGDKWCVCLERDAGDFLHDGFYLRFGVAIGYVWDFGDTTSGPNAGQDIRFRAFSVPVELQMGGTPLSGFVIGGHFAIHGGEAQKYINDVESTPPDGTRIVVGTVGAFASYYFNPRRGWHAQMVGGFTSLLEQNGNGDNRGDRLNGPSVTLGAGWDVFLATESSIGLGLRMQYARLTRVQDSGSEVHSLLAPSLLASWTVH
jgi:hypothetical protein